IHGIASALGGMFEAPHGALCAALLPAAIDVNITKILKLPAEHKTEMKNFLNRFAAVGEVLDTAMENRDSVLRGNGYYGVLPEQRCVRLPEQSHAILRERVMELCRRMKIPPLNRWGITEEDVPLIAKSSECKNNPVKLEQDEIERIISSSLY
ncbi:MAG: iron-containing alcohol dehydrogenase, partial [Thermoplasmata archaeon]